MIDGDELPGAACVEEMCFLDRRLATVLPSLANVAHAWTLIYFGVCRQRQFQEETRVNIPGR